MKTVLTQLLARWQKARGAAPAKSIRSRAHLSLEMLETREVLSTTFTGLPAPSGPLVTSLAPPPGQTPSGSFLHTQSYVDLRNHPIAGPGFSPPPAQTQHSYIDLRIHPGIAGPGVTPYHAGPALSYVDLRLNPTAGGLKGLTPMPVQVQHSYIDLRIHPGLVTLHGIGGPLQRPQNPNASEAPQNPFFASAAALVPLTPQQQAMLKADGVGTLFTVGDMYRLGLSNWKPADGSTRLTGPGSGTPYLAGPGNGTPYLAGPGSGTPYLAGPGSGTPYLALAYHGTSGDVARFDWGTVWKDTVVGGLGGAAVGGALTAEAGGVGALPGAGIGAGAGFMKGLWDAFHGGSHGSSSPGSSGGSDYYMPAEPPTGPGSYEWYVQHNPNLNR